MALEINVYDSGEFEQMITNRDYRISKALIDVILKNLTAKKNNYHVLSVNIESEQLIYDITVDRNDFKTVLENHLPIFEKNEEYETCAEIVKALKVINSTPTKRRGRPKKTLDS